MCATAVKGIITLDASGTIQSASDSVRRVLGWTPDELIGRKMDAIAPGRGYSVSSVRAGRLWRFDAMRNDGTFVPIELLVLRTNAGGGASLYVGIIRNGSGHMAAERRRNDERMRWQQQFAEQTAALEAVHMQLRLSDRMATIGTLAAGLGHDMSNVLLPIRARLNALRVTGGSGGLNAGQRNHVEDIHDSVAYLQQLADGLHFLALDPESPEARRGGGASTDLRAWWKQTGPLLSRAVPRHVRVTATFATDLPRAAVAAHGLTQAVLNLIVNAGEAIPGPGVRKRRQGLVRLHADVAKVGHGDWIRLTVKDNGIGMTDEVRRRAFDMFYTTKPRGLGTGLGLALVRRAADRAGGSATIDSVEGEGTMVTLLLPIHEVGGHAASAGTGPVALVSLRDGRATELIRQILEAWGAISRREVAPQQADIWVVSPVELDLTIAQRWRDDHPHGRLVLAGAPEAHAARLWRGITSIVIEDPSDLDDVRTALGRAVSTESSGERTWQ